MAENYVSRPLVEKDYDVLVKWWEWFRFPHPTKDFLPDYGTGGLMMELLDGTPVCAGFLYITNSDLCWVEFIVSNPEIKDEPTRKTCQDALIVELCSLGKSQGYKYAYNISKHESLINTYIRNGFKKCSTNATDLLKIL